MLNCLSSAITMLSKKKSVITMGHLSLFDPLCINYFEGILLGSKDLGFYVFRTLMYIVGKP